MNTLAERYRKICKRLQDVCTSCQRNVNEVTLIAVSKHRPLEEIDILFQEGQHSFGESRFPDCLEKVEKRPNLQWHYVGSLQSNKVKKVIEHFSWIHSIDSLALAQKIAHLCQKLPDPPSLLLQINCSKEKTKRGFYPEELLSVLPQIASIENLNIKGLMTMAPFTKDQARIRSCFSTCKELLEVLRIYFPDANHLSMGMSNDWEIALEEGATLLRLGSALFTGC